MEQLSWEETEPRYLELAATPLSRDTLPAWLAEWSRLSDLLEETQMRLWIECMRDTTSPERAEQRRRFEDDIGVRATAFDRRLERKLADCGFEPDGFAIPLRNLRARSGHRGAGGGDREDQLCADERRLTERYQALQANRIVTGPGGLVAVSSLARALEQEPVRAEREHCWRLLAEHRRADRSGIDDLWRNSLRVRQQIAAAAGYRHYRDYQWRQLLRLDYSPQDCQSLAAAIEDAVVPAASALWEKRRRRMDVSEIRPWDAEFHPAASQLSGLAREAGRRRGNWAKLFGAIDPDFGSCFETLEREGLLDLEARPGKADMNFAGPLQASRRAFVFTQLNGIARDTFMLSHEAGHAFHIFEMFAQPYHQQRADAFIPIEFGEFAAMTMEFIAPMHMHEAGFCAAEQQERLRTMRLERALTWWLPACARIDSFQHWAYDNPDQAMDVDQCDQQWAELSLRYFPWIAWGDEAAICAGEWRHVMYIFTNPFYFIGYAFATLGALQVLAAYEADRRAAISRYRSALRMGATATVPELFSRAGATFAFDVGSVRATVDALMNSLERTRE